MAEPAEKRWTVEEFLARDDGTDRTATWLRLGFLGGIEGLIFHTLQRFWFRFLIDARIWERQRARSHLHEPRQGARALDIP